MNNQSAVETKEKKLHVERINLILDTLIHEKIAFCSESDALEITHPLVSKSIDYINSHATKESDKLPEDYSLFRMSPFDAIANKIGEDFYAEQDATDVACSVIDAQAYRTVYKQPIEVAIRIQYGSPDNSEESNIAII